MQLFEIDIADRDVLHVIARTSDEAADLFVTWSVANGREPSDFSVEAVALDKLPIQQLEEVQHAIAAGLAGIAHLDPEYGWTFSRPLWLPLGCDEAGLKHGDHPPTAMRLFEFRDTNEISAVVIAADYNDATEIFEEYVLAEGGDPDSLLWREIALNDLQAEASSAVLDALQLNRDGLVICQGDERWLFIASLDHRGPARTG